MIIRALDPHADELLIPSLAAMLIEAVAGGAGLSFIHPLPPERAEEHWRGAFRGASQGDRVILAALEAGAIIGTVTVFLATPDNQPHRAEIWKMIVASAARRRGVGEALMRAAEGVARGRSRTLLTLDTFAESDATRLYERLGFIRAGIIPDYAYQPDGRLDASWIYYKPLAP